MDNFYTRGYKNRNKKKDTIQFLLPLESFEHTVVTCYC